MPKYIYGIDNVLIRFDDKDGFYEAGQVLSGKVIVSVSSTTSFAGVQLKLTGTLKIKWMEMEAGSMIPFEEFQMLLNDKVDIFRVNRKKPQEAWIFPGKHVYDFRYQLPFDLPYSLDGSRYGRIEYKSKAEVLIPNSYPIESLEEEFFIHSRDSAEEEELQMAQELSLPKENTEYGSVGGGCFARKSHIEVHIKLDRSVYKQGQHIKPEVEVTLETGKVKVEGLMVLLVQEMVYACNLGEEDECRKKEILVVSDQLVPEEVGPGEQKKFSPNLAISKALPATGFPHCDCIQLGYSVHAVAKVGKLYDDVVAKLPIVIMYGDESEWDEEEKERCLGDDEAFGFDLDEELEKVGGDGKVTNDTEKGDGDEKEVEGDENEVEEDNEGGEEEEAAKEEAIDENMADEGNNNENDDDDEM